MRIVKVALLTNLPEDLDHPRGGVQSTAVALIRALARVRDLELHVIVVNRHVATDREENLDGARLYYRKTAPLPVLAAALTQQRRVVSRILALVGPDIIHACDTSYFKVRHGGCPVLYQVQGTISLDTMFEPRFGWVRSRAWRYLEHRGLRSADAVLVNSPYVARLISKQRTGRVYILDEPVSPEFFAARRRERAGTMLFVGQLSELKNPLPLVRAVARLRDRGIHAQLRLAGDGEPDYINVVRKAMNRLQVATHCKLLGRLSRAALIDELAAASVLAHPSFREHAPAAIAEAMVVGVPVVASAVGGIPYMIEDGQTGFLIDPNDPNELPDRLAQVLCDDALRGTMSNRAAEVARERFSGDAAAGRLLDCYESVLSSWHSRRRTEVTVQ